MNKNPIDVLFANAFELKASDIHMAVDAPILFRIDGELVPQTEQPVTAEQAAELVKGVLGEIMFKRFQAEREIDVSYQLKDGTRLRVNCAFERGNPTIVARIIPMAIPSLEDISLQGLAPHITPLREGLVLFTGPTGSGKSTSLAALIQAIHTQRPINLITLEDPVEFLFLHDRGIVRQRQFGQDFLSFAEGMKHVLRQDPDVVMVGEMRDPETVSAALTLAETGHLIFATLHTPNTVQTVDRIIDVFPPHQQGQVRSQLSMSLKAVVSQKLVPREGGGRVALREVLINTPAVGNIIRDNRAQELKSVLQTNENIGMISFEKAAKQLYKEGGISKQTYEFILATM